MYVLRVLAVLKGELEALRERWKAELKGMEDLRNGEGKDRDWRGTGNRERRMTGTRGTSPRTGRRLTPGDVRWCDEALAALKEALWEGLGKEQSRG